MYLLNDLKDFYVYNKRAIVGIDKNIKNTKKDIVILHAGMNPLEFKSFYENNLYKQNFRSFYVPYRFHTNKMKKTVTLDQKSIYNDIRSNIEGITKVGREITTFNKLNLIYDLSYETKYIMTEYHTKGLNYIKAYLNFLELKYKSIDYNNKIITVLVPDNTQLANMTINNTQNPFNIIYLAMTKGHMSEGFNGVKFIFYTNNGAYIKFTYNKNLKKAELLKAFNKIAKTSSVKNVVEDETPVETSDTKQIISNQLDKENTIDGIIKVYLTKLGVDVNKPANERLTEYIDELVSNISDKLNNLDMDINMLKGEDVTKILVTEPEILRLSKIVSDLAIKGKTNDIYASKLKEKQDNVIFNGETLSNILTSVQNLAIDKKKLESNNIINEEVKESTSLDFDESYSKKQMKKDMINILTSFNNDEDIRLYVTNIKEENTSDIFTKKMTYTISFQDENKNSHTFKINYPILKDNKFMIAGGGRKLILKQLLLLPIVKTKPDTVQITTNYNKIFIYRFGDKLTDGTEALKKLLFQNLDDSIIKASRLSYKRGNASSFNKTPISLEYGELSKHFSFIENNNYYLSFNQSELMNEINKRNIKLTQNANTFPVAINKNSNTVIFANDTDGTVIDDEGIRHENLVSFIVENILSTSLMPEKIKEFYATAPSKTLAYNRARITGRAIPIIILLSYEKGLKHILDRYDLDYEFIKSDRVPKEFGKKRMKFADGYLTYSSTDLKATLLLDGLTTIDTSNYTFSQMNTKEPYIEYFADNHGSRNIGKGIHNMLSLMVDPITKEVLESLELPTDIIDIILYANTLLATSKYNVMNDMSCYRLRGAEQVNAVLYKILADAFKTYKDTSNNGNPIKISVDPDILIKKLNAEKTVDEYSILNPSLEIDKASSVTYKGPSGINLDDAYTTEIRAYSGTMKGLLSTPTPDSDKCGVVRQLSYDPRILNIRGMLDVGGASNVNTNLYCASELLNNFTCTHADPPRIGMQSTQQKHIIPTKVQSRPLFGTGVDRTIPYIISDDFVFAAKKPGILEKIDKKNEIAILKYDDGTSDIIDLSEIVSKNSNGGFFLANSKQLLIKEGERFKVNDVIAKNPGYFTGDDPSDVVYTTGKLCKIALVSMDGTYEDSSMITKKMSKEMTAKITMKKEVNLGINSNIEFLIKKGDKVKTGDPLVIFDTSFEDSSINALLGGLGDEIDELTKNELHSKYTGRIVDVNIYYNHDIEEYTPSVQKIINDYIKENKSKVNAVNKIVGEDSLRLVNVKSINKVNSTKIKGTDVDGILIEVYIEYEDDMSIGDKCTYATALKTTISDVFDEGEEPFSAFKPEENLDALFPSLSVITRMTTDLFFQMYLNKGLLGLKDAVTKMWNEK